MRTLLCNDGVTSTINLDSMYKLRQAGATPYSQAQAFLELLDGATASPAAVLAIKAALKDANAVHLLKINHGELLLLVWLVRSYAQACRASAVASTVVSYIGDSA